MACTSKAYEPPVATPGSHAGDPPSGDTGDGGDDGGGDGGADTAPGGDTGEAPPVVVDCAAGGAFFEGADGDVEDLSEALAAGDESLPASLLFIDPGTLHICPGTWYAHLTLADDVAVLGVEGRDATTLDGGALDTVIRVEGAFAVTLQGLTIAAGETPLYGGGLLATGGEITIESCAFRGNYASLYGGAAALYGATLALRDVIFEDNTTDMIWGHGYAPGGGALYLEGGVAALTDARFERNYSGEGGGLHLFEAEATLAGVSFGANVAQDGGGLFVRDGAAALEGGEFDSNGAQLANGGGVSLTAGALTASGVRFVGNYTFFDGGALSMINGSGAALTAVTFEGSEALGLGGAIYLGGGGLTVSVSDFAENAPDDTWVEAAGASYTWGAAATFTCDSAGCVP